MDRIRSSLLGFQLRLWHLPSLPTAFQLIRVFYVQCFGHILHCTWAASSSSQRQVQTKKTTVSSQTEPERGRRGGVAADIPERFKSEGGENINLRIRSGACIATGIYLTGHPPRRAKMPIDGRCQDMLGSSGAGTCVHLLYRSRARASVTRRVLLTIRRPRRRNPVSFDHVVRSHKIQPRRARHRNFENPSSLQFPELKGAS